MKQSPKYVPGTVPFHTELQPRPPSSRKTDTKYPQNAAQTQIHQFCHGNDQTSSHRNNPTQQRRLSKRIPVPPPTLKPMLVSPPQDICSTFKRHQNLELKDASRKRITSPNFEYNHLKVNKKIKPESCAGDQHAQQAAHGIDRLSLKNDNASKKAAISQHYSVKVNRNTATPSGRPRQRQRQSRKDTKHQNPDISTLASDLAYWSKVPEACPDPMLKHNHAPLQQSQGLSNVTAIWSHEKILEGIHPTAHERESSIDKQHHDYGSLKQADSELGSMTTTSMARSSSGPSSFCYSYCSNNKETDQHGRPSNKETRQHGRRHCGLDNPGNTCFMNSAIQCMSNTEPLREYFLPSAECSTPKYKKDINKKNPLGMGGAIAEAFGKLLEEMWNGSCTYTSPHELKAEISRFAPRFADFHQQDSQELMAFLLDGLHEDLNRVTVKSYDDVDLTTVDSKDISDKDLAEKSWKNHLLRNNSRIVDIFQGQLMATVSCLCGNVSRVCDPFMFLALPIPKEMSRYRHKYEWDPNSGLKTINMTNCIELMMDNTILDSWYCTKCKMFVKASRIVNIMRLPEVLIIYFKRFSCSGYTLQ